MLFSPSDLTQNPNKQNSSLHGVNTPARGSAIRPNSITTYFFFKLTSSLAPSTFFLTSLLNSPSRLGFFHALPQHIKRAEAEAGGGRRGRGEREEGRGEASKIKKINKSY